jgi:hypothetical protein
VVVANKAAAMDPQIKKERAALVANPEAPAAVKAKAWLASMVVVRWVALAAEANNMAEANSMAAANPVALVVAVVKADLQVAANPAALVAAVAKVDLQAAANPAALVAVAKVDQQVAKLPVGTNNLN